MPSYPLNTRPKIDDLITAKKSMLGDNRLPDSYSSIQRAEDAEAKAYPKNTRAVRVFIIWDNEVGNFPLDDVLEKMRETGAAMVWKVEPLV